ncbi:DNA mismatch repair protein MutS [Candidatus Nomurabacteria bacterium]|nr:DNA mismatch repair protein MutS [Candidatus Nomurabacteria bacterium]
MKKTPMMQQYVSFKRQYPDKLVLFRMGDFYETFGEDAKLASKILNITLTTRDKTTDPTPLAGFPHHALDQYLPKIIEGGYCAVVVEQLEDPKLAKGVVKRGVTRIVTPGTLDGDLADSNKNPYLLAVYKDKSNLGAALVDLSTGLFKVTSSTFSQDFIESLLSSYDPCEILLSSDEENVSVQSIPVQIVDSSVLKGDLSVKRILDFYKVKSLDSLALENDKAKVNAISMVLYYIEDTQKMKPEHLDRPAMFKRDGTMVLDRATIRNLDLVQNSFTGSVKNSLIDILDQARTPMGRRMLYQWILNPLVNKKDIDKRLSIVEAFYRDNGLLASCRSLLDDINDIDRIVGRIGLNRANARDLKALQASLIRVSELTKLIKSNKQLKSAFDFSRLFDKSVSDNLGESIEMIEKAVHDSPPLSITEGGIIRSGYSGEVDELRRLSGNSKAWVKEFIAEEKEKTKIPTLKIGFNKVFGYYIEVTKAHQNKVPENYIRKQTLVNSERYITEDLKKKEEIILGAEAKLSELEYRIFQELRVSILKYIPNLKIVGSKVAELDVLSNFAFVSRNNIYVKPEIKNFAEDGGKIEILGGRHPVIEQLSEEDFVSNDVRLRIDKSRMCIITGPNMSGKSTFIRQVALIVLMAQIGCFVPADSAKITLTDRIFSRVGAADNLAQGRSTFMVEMEEAANILNNATENSLIILDEVGRGTSTYDGVSIAWALSEYLIRVIKARTLFATHYHELLELETEHPDAVKNYNVYVKENDDEVVFLRKIVEGGTDKSYGIHVGKMAGLPEMVTERASEILKTLEEKKNQSGDAVDRHKQVKKSYENEFSSSQLTMYEQFDSEVRRIVSEVELEKITPIEALNLLVDIKNRLS